MHHAPHPAASSHISPTLGLILPLWLVYNLPVSLIRPLLVAMRDLMSDERHTGAVLKFARATKVGMVKAGVVRFLVDPDSSLSLLA